MKAQVSAGWLLSMALLSLGAPSQAKAGPDDFYNISQVKEFLSKKVVCAAAFATVSQAHMAVQNRTDIVTSDVLCLTDLVSNAGTIDEARGCGIAFLDIKTGEFQNPISLVNGVSCKAGGAEKVTFGEGNPAVTFFLKSQRFVQAYSFSDYYACSLFDRYTGKKKSCAELRPKPQESKSLVEKAKALFGK